MFLDLTVISWQIVTDWSICVYLTFLVLEEEKHKSGGWPNAIALRGWSQW
jgi:hypothetical protein